MNFRVKISLVHQLQEKEECVVDNVSKKLRSFDTCCVGIAATYFFCLLLFSMIFQTLVISCLPYFESVKKLKFLFCFSFLRQISRLSG